MTHGNAQGNARYEVLSNNCPSAPGVLLAGVAGVLGVVMTLVVRMPRERDGGGKHSISAFVIMGDVTHVCTSKLIN